MQTIVLAGALGGVVVAAGGVGMMLLAHRSAAGTLKRNQLVGVRTSASLSSPEAWEAAQQAAAPRTAIGAWGSIIGGGAAIVSALLAWALQLNSTAMGTGVLVAVVAGAAWMLCWVSAATTKGDRIARKLQFQQQQVAGTASDDDGQSDTP